MYNFKNHLKTTFTGLTLCGTCLLFVYMGKATFTEVAGFLMSGFSLLFANDELFK